MSPLEQLIMKKREEGKSMSPLEQKAKMDNLTALRDEMSSMMKGDLAPGAKVEVAASSPEGLKDGLDKAQDVVSAGDDSGEGEMAMPGSDDMDKDSDEMSSEEIDQLQMLLDKLKKSKMV